MKIFAFILTFFFLSLGFGQTGVGINTSDLSPGSALQIDSNNGGLVQPRMTTAQMNAIPTPLDGALVYNTTQKNWYIRTDGVWHAFTRSETPSVILNRQGGTVEISSSEILTPFPLNQNNILANDSKFYALSSNAGEVKVLRSGTYLITAGFSTSNLDSGSKIYRVEVFVNNTISEIITNGEINIPGTTDYWGTSGNILLTLNANDLVSIKYILKGLNQDTRNGKFFNIGLSKL